MVGMRSARLVRWAAPWLLVLGLPAATWAQVPTGPGLSSGSGAGTGTGAEAGTGLGTTGTGTEAGFGLGTTGTGMESGAATRFGPYRSVGPGALRGSPLAPGLLNPGAGFGTRSPTDRMPPADAILPGQGPAADAKSLSTLYADLLERARGLDQPGERSMACERVARSAIFTSHFDEAHAALVEAREAAMREPDQLVREQRILACVTSLLSLAEALVRDGMADESQFAGNKPQPGRTLQERLVWLQNAEGEWERAADLTLRLSNPNFRTQIMYQVVDSQAIGSQTIANQVLRASVAQSNLVSQADRLNTEADRALVLAARHARLIERPIWRDRALVAVAGNAANSNQFRRGLAIARTIPQPEVRTDGLIRIAEAQARRNFNEAATETYTEAARAVASIPQTDPRVILAGVLIDSLVAVGRFDDARESVIFYPDYSHQVLALGAIAESQGARGQSEAARDWIARSGPAEYRPYLYRRVNDGILAAVDKSRSTELTNEGYQQRP